MVKREGWEKVIIKIVINVVKYETNKLSKVIQIEQLNLKETNKKNYYSVLMAKK